MARNCDDKPNFDPDRREPKDPGASCLQVFAFDGADVRAVLIDGQPWWVLADVARVLGYRDAANAARLLRDHQRGYSDVSTPGGTQRMTILSKSGLNRLVMRSSRDEAERFQDWIEGDVIPSIMSTGSYSVAPPAPALPQTYAEALRMLADQVEATAAAESRALALEPPARAWGALAEATGDFDVGTAAKMLSRDPAISIGRQRLFAKLVDLGMVYVEHEQGRNAYKPRQQHVDAGRLRLRHGGSWTNPKTEEMKTAAAQVRITTKGLEYLHGKLGGVGSIDVEPNEGPLELVS